MYQYILCAVLSVSAMSIGAQQLISPVLATPVPTKQAVSTQQQMATSHQMVKPETAMIQRNKPFPRPTPSHLLVGSSDLSLTRTVPLARVTSSIAEMAPYTTAGKTRMYQPIDVEVLDVMDRGEILVQTKEQVRIRGARVPSEKATRRVDVIYAREANDWLKKQLIGKKVILDFVDAPRDRYGALHGRFLLPDEKNADILQGLLTNGLARLNEEDLWESAPVKELKALEDKARREYKGVWLERE